MNCLAARLKTVMLLWKFYISKPKAKQLFQVQCSNLQYLFLYFFPVFLLFVFGIVPGFQLFGIPPEIIQWLKLGGLRKETERVTVNPPGHDSHLSRSSLDPSNVTHTPPFISPLFIPFFLLPHGTEGCRQTQTAGLTHNSSCDLRDNMARGPTNWRMSRYVVRAEKWEKRKRKQWFGDRALRRSNMVTQQRQFPSRPLSCWE